MCGYTKRNVLGWNNYIRSKIIKDTTNIISTDDILTSHSTIVNEFNEAYLINSEDYFIVEIGNTVNENGLKGFIVKLKSTYDHKETPYLFILDHSDAENVALFLLQVQSITQDILSMPKAKRGMAWKNKYYKDFKDKIILMKTFYDNYGKPIVEKDIDYAYTLTIHKTQGSTYKHAYINVLDVLYDKNNMPIRDIDMRNRLLYVALSRASKTANLLI